jgi:hypothetical protein
VSAQEIIAQLCNLKGEELQLVKAQVDVLMTGASELKRPVDSAQPAPASAGAGKETLAEFLLRVAGTAQGLPEDMAKNHDHYLYGTPKRLER